MEHSRPGPRLRHRARCRERLASPRLRRGPFRAVGCPEKHFELSCVLTGRDRLPSPECAGWDRLSTVFRYYAVIRLLPSHYHLVQMRPRWLPPFRGGREISPGKNVEFHANLSPLREPHEQILGLATERRLVPAVSRLIDASLVLSSALHLRLPSDPTSRSRPCLVGVWFPLQGPRKDLESACIEHFLTFDSAPMLDARSPAFLGRKAGEPCNWPYFHITSFKRSEATRGERLEHRGLPR